MNSNVRARAGRAAGGSAPAAKGVAKRTGVGCQKTDVKAHLIRLVCAPLGQVRLEDAIQPTPLDNLPTWDV